MKAIVAQIKSEFADAEGWPRTTPLARAQVLDWMQHDDLEVLGALNRLLRYKGGLERIQPPLDFDTYFAFVTGYYRRCLCEYSEAAQETWEEAEVGFEASHAVVLWFVQLWLDKSVPRTALHQLKAWFAETLEVCPQTRGLLLGELSDHLMQQRRFRKFFADWENNPLLHAIMAGGV